MFKCVQPKPYIKWIIMAEVTPTEMSNTILFCVHIGQWTHNPYNIDRRNMSFGNSSYLSDDCSGNAMRMLFLEAATFHIQTKYYDRYWPWQLIVEEILYDRIIVQRLLICSFVSRWDHLESNNSERVYECIGDRYKLGRTQYLVIFVCMTYVWHLFSVQPCLWLTYGYIWMYSTIVCLIEHMHIWQPALLTPFLYDIQFKKRENPENARNGLNDCQNKQSETITLAKNGISDICLGFIVRYHSFCSDLNFFFLVKLNLTTK